MSEELRIAGNIQSYMSGDGLDGWMAIPQTTTTDSSVPTFVEVGRAQKWSSSNQSHPRIVSDNF